MAEPTPPRTQSRPAWWLATLAAVLAAGLAGLALLTARLPHGRKTAEPAWREEFERRRGALDPAWREVRVNERKRILRAVYAAPAGRYAVFAQDGRHFGGAIVVSVRREGEGPAALLGVFRAEGGRLLQTQVGEDVGPEEAWLAGDLARKAVELLE